MPTSIYNYIPTFVEYLRETHPASVLDVGIGYGKLGFITREMLDVVMGGRHQSQDWQIQIDGIEVFPEYIQNHQKAIYNKIYLGDAFDIIPLLKPYDLIILGDVLEHFQKDKAWELMDRCFKIINHYLILNIPLGENWHQDEMYGNRHEKHLSSWSWEELSSFVWKYKFFGNDTMTYATLLIRKTDYQTYKSSCLENG